MNEVMTAVIAAAVISVAYIACNAVVKAAGFGIGTSVPIERVRRRVMPNEQA